MNANKQFMLVRNIQATTSSFGCNYGSEYNYEFTIDINGNVLVLYRNSPTASPSSWSQKTTYLSVEDNIPVPADFIKIFNMPFNNGPNSILRNEQVVMFFEIVKSLKKFSKKKLENPMTEIDQVECFIQKIELIEKEKDRIEKEYNKYFENYFSALNDIRNIKEENARLKEKMKEIEKSKEKIIYKEKIVEIEKIVEKIVPAVPFYQVYTEDYTSLYNETSRNVVDNNYMLGKYSDI
jgi:ribosomal protein S8